MARKLVVEIVADASHYTRGIEAAERVTKSFAGTVTAATVGVGTLVKSFVVLDVLNEALRGVNETVHAGIDEFKESSRIQAQTAAALKSTGDISGKTAEQIHGLSLELSNLSGQSDESIQSAENVLLSFTNIRDSLGKNNDIFTQATKTVVDFSARTGKDAPAAAVLLGKALQDPAKRVGILARAGVVLTKSQTEYLKATENSKGILAAQKILLGDLATRFSGAAAAAGHTLPGALNILKERFRDLAGEGVGAVAPALTRAAVGLAGFVVKLTDAHGASAKFKILLSGIKNVAVEAFNGLRTAISRINWSAVAQTISDGLSAAWTNVRDVGGRLGRRIGDELRRINWSAAIRQAAHGLSVAIGWIADELDSLIRKIDWAKLGKYIVDGIAIAIGVTIKFLSSLDWGKIVHKINILLGDAVQAAENLLAGIGIEIGRLLWKGLQAALDRIATVAKQDALKIALAIVEPLSHIPTFLGGGPFQRLKAQFEQDLADLAKTTHAGGAAVAVAFGTGYQDAIPKAAHGVAAAAATTTTTSTGAPAAPLVPAGADLLGGGSGRKGLTANERATQRNTWFDAMIGRLLDQAQDGTIRQQITKLKAVGQLITARIAATKDVTRRLTLEQELLDQVTRPIKALQQQRADQASQTTVAAANLAIARAQATPGYQDDLATQQHLVEILKKQLAADRQNADLQTQLFDAEQAVKDTLKQRADTAKQAKLDAGQLAIARAGLTTSLQDDLAGNLKYLQILRATHASALDIVNQQTAIKGVRDQIAQQHKQDVADAKQRAKDAADAALARRNALQFRQLGLGPTGGALIPELANLRKRYQTIKDAVKGTFLDTPKTGGELDRIGNILAGKFGKVSETVRAAIDQFYKDIRDKLKSHQGDQTKFRHMSSAAFVDSLGVNLTLAQRRAIESRFSTVGAHNTVPPGRSGQFTGAVTINGGLHMHGVQDMAGLENEFAKRTKARAHTRRGA